MLFHRAGTAIKKAFNKMAWFNKKDLECVLSTSSGEVSRNNRRKSGLQVAWPYAMKGLYR